MKGGGHPVSMVVEYDPTGAARPDPDHPKKTLHVYIRPGDDAHEVVSRTVCRAIATHWNENGVANARDPSLALLAHIEGLQSQERHLQMLRAYNSVAIRFAMARRTDATRDAINFYKRRQRRVADFEREHPIGPR